MKILLRQATVVNPKSKFHGQKLDIEIINGIITKIDDNIEPNGHHIVASNNLHVSAGWVDTFANFCDPGYEHRETLESGMMCAAKGGFTHVCLSPNTSPVIETKGQIEYILSKSKKNAVSLHPLGALTKELNGVELTELNDMYNAGAIAFCNGNSTLTDSGNMSRALQYAKMFDYTVYSYCNELTLCKGAHVHEGQASILMGIKGIPNLAEELPLQRDIALLEYTNSKLHLTKIASAAALELIKNAKKKKLSLSVGVSINQLLFKDMDQIDFDTNLKFAPIVKTENDRKTLIKALKDGWIDVVCSDHEPLEIECKFLEFDEAKPGAIGLQTIYSNLNKLLESNTDLIINLLSENARKILKLSDYEIDTGIVADLTMFDPSIEWIFESDTNSSLSSNSSQLGATMYGGVLGIINNLKQLFF